MIVALVIVSIIAVLGVAGTIFFISVSLSLANRILEFELYSDDFDEIPEEMVEQEYPDTLLVCNLETTEEEEGLFQVYDTSLYLKNHVIGLTLFVQEQMLEDIAQHKKMEAQDIKDAVNNAIIPCTVYQLKNGGWIWRIRKDYDDYE